MEIEKHLSFFKGKKVLVTGHTGFKGTWLSIWLQMLGAELYGISLEPKNENDLYRLTNASMFFEKDYRIDIRDKSSLIDAILDIKPDIVFHLAAQALVLDSYSDPIGTFETNTLGTANVLEAIRLTKTVRVGVFVTTDKVYQNNEWVFPYREDEKLGGYDPYSASKGAAELIISSYRDSFFNVKEYNEHKSSIASVRAGNVIGGGDWAKNRIVPDSIKSIENNQIIEVRNPQAVRPWQHVLEPLGGYLLLASKMLMEPTKYNEAWNFGPEPENIVNVGCLVNELIEKYGKGKWKDTSVDKAPHEAKLLALDINKAKYKLNWKPRLNFCKTIRYTAEWYLNYKKDNVLDLCQNQIKSFIKIGAKHDC